MGNKAKGWVGAHPVLAGLGVLVVVTAGVGTFVWNSLFGLESSVVYFGVPDAPALTATTGETLYRIDASDSQVTYSVDEKLAGTTHTATGTTRGIAGDIALNAENPAASRVGDIVVNVQQLTSDQQLRDERLRHDYLESNDYQTATFSPTELDGLPERIDDGVAYDFTIAGNLTVKETTRPTTLKATGTLDGDTLTLEASTTVSLSAFGVGPINMVGFAQAGDDATLDFDITAVDAADFDDSDRVAAEAAPAAAAPSGTSPSFATQVKPTLENSCASCHQAGEAGAPFWELTEAKDAVRVADGLALITKSRYMPPFLATDAGIPLQHDPRLSDDEITAIGDWAAAGAPLDVAEDEPIQPPDDVELHPRADKTLTAEAPYQGSTKLTNDYRCLIMDPKVTEPTVVTGYEFVPDKNEFVHHALTFRMSADQREGVEERDAKDPGTGYECFGGVGAGGAGLSPSGRTRSSSLVAGWAPGARPGQYPDGAGLKLEPGDFFVTQIHYHYVHAAPPDQSELVLQLGEGDPADYDDVRVSQYLAPAEMPCMPDEQGPLCDREAAIDALTEEFGPSAATIANGLNAICGSTPEETANVDADGISTAECEHPVSAPGKLLSVNGHMHELGRTFRMTLNPGTPDEKILLDIDRWDFNWQFNYVPTEDIELTKDDTIKVECSWDRNLINPQFEPRWITWSEGTEDEMCFSTVATIERRE
ncbi:MAG: YceI family protein [Microthrixaceae bacterium]